MPIAIANVYLMRVDRVRLDSGRCAASFTLPLPEHQPFPLLQRSSLDARSYHRSRFKNSARAVVGAEAAERIGLLIAFRWNSRDLSIGITK
ncbi:hypothetical protein EVAR_70246_1 [Eumeta japonica]|uniref:Uncharacterized protein n=1 Tax=Eumeta variegata TaxID=151549 RepID=A0A4C2A5Z3_EUMVA|nr:hypothetical protein EVAR_70246_1 [Eumeta japonica]